MALRRLFALCTLFAVAAIAVDARADDGATVTFKYKQRQFLYSRNGPGGLAYVTAGAQKGASLPVMVFLHGMNPDGLVHPWFGPPYGDIRPVIDALVASGKVAPMIVAAPTHTRFATGATVMWHDLDLGDFLDETDRALGGAAKVDRSRVVVVGHSGAGCNPTGGLFAPSLRDAKVSALVDVDGCLDEKARENLSSAATWTTVRFYWQSTWTRPVAELASVCTGCKVEEIGELPPKVSPHVAILPKALERALPELLPR